MKETYTPIYRSQFYLLQKGHLTVNEFLVLCLLQNCADFSTGLWKGDANRLAYALGEQLKERTVQVVLSELAKKKFIKIFHKRGSRLPYPIAIHGFCCRSGEQKGSFLDAHNTTDFKNPRYATTLEAMGEVTFSHDDSHVEPSPNMDAVTDKIDETPATDQRTISAASAKQNAGNTIREKEFKKSRDTELVADVVGSGPNTENPKYATDTSRVRECLFTRSDHLKEVRARYEGTFNQFAESRSYSHSGVDEFERDGRFEATADHIERADRYEQQYGQDVAQEAWRRGLQKFDKVGDLSVFITTTSSKEVRKWLLLKFLAESADQLAEEATALVAQGARGGVLDYLLNFFEPEEREIISGEHVTAIGEYVGLGSAHEQYSELDKLWHKHRFCDIDGLVAACSLELSLRALPAT